MKNLEIKIRTNLEEIEKKLTFAKYIKDLHQVDTYFLVGERRLKLREETDGTEVIYYVRPNIKTSRESSYIRLLVPFFLRKVVPRLLEIIFGKKTEVVKEREFFLYKNTRIHLDRVKNIGEFVELETVFNKNISTESLIAEHDQVKTYLGLQGGKGIPSSYSDMVLQHSI